MNSIHEPIKFTMKLMDNDSLPFFDILMTKRVDGILEFSFYRKATHTDGYLNVSLHHHPAQSTMWQEEQTHLFTALAKNGHKQGDKQQEH